MADFVGPLAKLAALYGMVTDGLNQKNDAKVVLEDLKRIIDEANADLAFLNPRIESDAGLLHDNQELKARIVATIVGLEAHVEEATHHVKKWNAYWRISKAGRRGKRRKRLMQEVHWKLFQVRAVVVAAAA